MAYIGREPQIGNYQVCDAISVVNGQAAYTMQVSSVNVIPESVNHMIVSLNGVIQNPGSSYTISSSTITFSSNLATGDSIDFIYLLGNVLDLGTPSDDTVTGAKIVDNAINSEHYTDGSIDLAHLSADSVDGSKIADDAINSEHYTDGSIDTAHIADGQVTTAKLATAVFTGATDIGADIADADLFLMDDGAGGTIRKTAASRIKTYAGGAGGATGLDLNDSVKIRLGTGNDTELFFDGTNTIFDHTSGSGGLYIRADGIAIQDTQSTPLNYMDVSQGSGVVFNEGSNDFDFRVESNGQSHMLFVDGGNDRIGILDSSPAYTLESGNSDSGKGWSLANENNVYKIRARSSASDTQTHIQFENTNGICGSIQTNGTTAAYNTSSDYRLKENIDYDWDATTRLKQLKPARFNWITDDTNTLLDGFIAHEVSSIVPEAITGTKDATETLTNVVKNADGSLYKCNFTEAEWIKGKADGIFAANSTWAATYSRPDYQSIDQSKLVPLLVKTIQELEARIKTLEDA